MQLFVGLSSTVVHQLYEAADRTQEKWYRRKRKLLALEPAGTRALDLPCTVSSRLLRYGRL